MDGARELTTADVLRRVRSIRPTSEVKREEIEELRRWAQEHLAIDAVRGETSEAASACWSSRQPSLVSKYLAYPQIIFKDRGLLLAALADLGYTQVEDGRRPAAVRLPRRPPT